MKLGMDLTIATNIMLWAVGLFVLACNVCLSGGFLNLFQ